jgi:membrane dipeptidase
MNLADSFTAERFTNEQIARQRSQALALLKPTGAQLEHGLALHRDALVIDAYGFSAFAAPDHAGIAAAAGRDAEPASLRHVELQSSMTRMAEDEHQSALFDEAWRAAGVTCVFRNSGEEGNSVERLLPRLAHNTFVTDRLPQHMRRITTARDITVAKSEHRYGFCLTTNGVPLPASWETAQSALRFIDVFRQLGVRMMHLTYNRRNLLGDGCAESGDGGLSDLGRQAVARMNRLGIIVDIAHSGETTGIEAARHSNRPVVISHATCRALHEHCRAKSDDLLEAVADTGGLIGICCVPAFLGGSGDLLAFLDHIDHAVRTIGDEHVAIGTDMPVTLPPGPSDSQAVPRVPMPPRFESLWPADAYAFSTQPAMLDSMAWTNWPLFTVGLVQRGHKDQTIRRIVGQNMLRVLQAHETSSPPRLTETV